METQGDGGGESCQVEVSVRTPQVDHRPRIKVLKRRILKQVKVRVYIVAFSFEC